MRRWAVLAVLGAFGCGSRPAALAPVSMDQAVLQFLAAVKANDITRMGDLWGTERGPAADWMKPEDLRKRLVVIQKYLDHDGSRIIQGPLDVAGHNDQRTYRVELQRGVCNRVQPIDVIRSKNGGWLVYDVHLESAGAPGVPCPPPNSGTGP